MHWRAPRAMLPSQRLRAVRSSGPSRCPSDEPPFPFAVAITMLLCGFLHLSAMAPQIGVMPRRVKP